MKSILRKKKSAEIRAPMILWISLALFVIIAGLAWIFFKRLQNTISIP